MYISHTPLRILTLSDSQLTEECREARRWETHTAPPPISSLGPKLLRRNLPPPPPPPLAHARSLHCLFTLSSLFLFLALTFSLTAFISQPSDRISKVLHGGQLTEEEAQTLAKRYITTAFISYSLLDSQLRSDLLVLFCFSAFLRSALKLVCVDLFVNLWLW